MKLTTPLLPAALLVLLVAAATAYPEDQDGELFRRKRSPGSNVEKFEKKHTKINTKEAKKYDHRAVIPVVHGPISHSQVVHHERLGHVSRYRRAPSIEMVKARKNSAKISKDIMMSRRRRESRIKKNEKARRNIAKEELRKDTKKGHVSNAPAGHAHHVSYHPQPHHTVQHPAQHNPQHTVHKTAQHTIHKAQHAIHKTPQHHGQHPSQHHEQQTIQHQHSGHHSPKSF